MTLKADPAPRERVDKTTGEILSDHELMEKLAERERGMTRLDEQIAFHQGEKKRLTEERELLIAEMRKLIRREPLPLFDGNGDEEDTRG